MRAHGAHGIQLPAAVLVGKAAGLDLGEDPAHAALQVRIAAKLEAYAAAPQRGARPTIDQRRIILEGLLGAGIAARAGEQRLCGPSEDASALGLPPAVRTLFAVSLKRRRHL